MVELLESKQPAQTKKLIDNEFPSGESLDREDVVHLRRVYSALKDSPHFLEEPHKLAGEISMRLLGQTSRIISLGILRAVGISQEEPETIKKEVLKSRLEKLRPHLH